MTSFDDIDLTVAEVMVTFKNNGTKLVVGLGERILCEVEVDEARIVVAVLTKLLAEVDEKCGGIVGVEVYEADPKKDT